MSNGAGGTIPAGLPDIGGDLTKTNIEPLSFKPCDSEALAFDGVFEPQLAEMHVSSNDLTSKTYIALQGISFKASRSNPIYGNSATVQPPAYKICAWKKIA